MDTKFEQLASLFARTDIYYNYADGQAYYKGKQTIDDFVSEYKKLSEEDKKEFYQLIKNQTSRVEYFEKYYELVK